MSTRYKRKYPPTPDGNPNFSLNQSLISYPPSPFTCENVHRRISTRSIIGIHRPYIPPHPNPPLLLPPPPRLRLKLPTFTLPSPMTVYSFILLTYFMVVSGIIYDVIVEPPGIGSTRDRFIGLVRPVIFLPDRVNGQYIIEGLSFGFMFVLGGIGIVLFDLALDKNRAKSVKVSYASAGVSFVVISYVMSMLFIRIKIPRYLR